MIVGESSHDSHMTYDIINNDVIEWKCPIVFQERINLNHMIVGESSRDSHMTYDDVIEWKCHVVLVN